jgi:hypothetical protein
MKKLLDLLLPADFSSLKQVLLRTTMLFLMGYGLISFYEIKAQNNVQVSIAHNWCSHPLARSGQPFRFTSWIENKGNTEIADLKVIINRPNGIRVIRPCRVIDRIGPNLFERIDWEMVSDSTGTFEFEVEISGVEQNRIIQMKGEKYRVLVIGGDEHSSRLELCTDEHGYWRRLNRPESLQICNSLPLNTIEHKKSSEINHNTYGICTHLPRSIDYEDPFNPVHLIDNDPETCWSSQQNNSSYPGIPPWIEIDLGVNAFISQFNLVPYWNNTDFPLGFVISTSDNGNEWLVSYQTQLYMFNGSGPRSGDKIKQVIILDRPVNARYVRIAFDRLPLSGGNYAEVSQGYKARLSGIEVLDTEGHNLALVAKGAAVKASDFFLGWQNTAESVYEAFPRIFDIGLKWVRVGQWGDQTEWAAVEREKGKYSIDSLTDAGINKLLDNGVDILYGLNYGNSLYECPQKPFFDIGPIYKEGHPFYFNQGPKTEAGRQAFVNYVDYVVRRYGDRIKWWELWNEENGWYPGHEAELYGKLLYAVARHIKSINTDLKVMYGGTAALAPITTEISIREGAAPFIDACAFHPYTIDKPEGGAIGTLEFYKGKDISRSKEQMNYKRIEDVIEGVKQPFLLHGNPNISVWMDEWGTNVTGLDYSYDPGIGEYGCTKYLMRFYIYGGWLGVPTAWWALHNLNMSQDWGILERNDYGFRPMSYALQNICSVVSDLRPVTDLLYDYQGQAPDPKIISFKRDDSGETLVLVWASELFTDDVRYYPSSLTFSLEKRPEQVRITDLYWGVTQVAKWKYKKGKVIIPDLIVRDYPVVITCEISNPAS